MTFTAFGLEATRAASVKPNSLGGLRARDGCGDRRLRDDPADRDRGTRDAEALGHPLRSRTRPCAWRKRGPKSLIPRAHVRLGEGGLMLELTGEQSAAEGLVGQNSGVPSGVPTASRSSPSNSRRRREKGPEAAVGGASLDHTVGLIVAETEVSYMSTGSRLSSAASVSSRRAPCSHGQWTCRRSMVSRPRRLRLASVSDTTCS